MSAKTKCAESFRLNDRVFAKMKSYPIWPAKIIEILDNDKYKVFFYGTHDCAVVPLSNVTKYEKLKNNIPKSKLKAYPSAVKEIKQDVNNKLFSCEKIKKYQKNLANKNKARNVKTKNESNDTNNKKRKIVTNSISDKGNVLLSTAGMKDLLILLRPKYVKCFQIETLICLKHNQQITSSPQSQYTLSFMLIFSQVLLAKKQRKIKSL